MYSCAVIYVWVLNYSVKSHLAETLNVQIFWCMPMDLWSLQTLDLLRRFATLLAICKISMFFCSIYPLLLFSDTIMFYPFSYRLPNSVRSNHAKELFIGWHRRYANIILLVHYLHIRLLLLEHALICLFILRALSMICLE
jgi:hypothetical protein